MSWFDSWVWPKVDTRRRAQNAIEEGFWAATLVSGVGLLFLLIEVMKDPEQFEIASLFGVAVFALIAFGIRRRSRVAAFAALILYVSDRIYVFVSEPFRSPVLPIFLTLAFLNAVRGTFAYHRFPVLPANLPSVEQSFRAMGSSARTSEEDKMHGAQ